MILKPPFHITSCTECDSHDYPCVYCSVELYTFSITLYPHMHCFLITAGSTPPNFTQEPQDTVVFGYDAAGKNASLFLNCTAAGNPFPDIVWYREEQALSNEVILADGSLLIENIVEGVDATREGLLYYCTANNTFGIIRSRVANVSYACR